MKINEIRASVEKDHPLFSKGMGAKYPYNPFTPAEATLFHTHRAYLLAKVDELEAEIVDLKAAIDELLGNSTKGAG